ncbi:MAG: glycosyltransferase family 39 protein [Chthoniobacteraceae bacterium]|nr:glycosyltransferase family 39 protein [Chthoniobacteraceae bacterium]
MTKRLFPWAALLLFWAALYLPGLGDLEIKGEEARRALPAVEMLQTGDWVVPHLNGTPYLRKPPLINWAIAASLRVTGMENEWSVRLPSVLAMLALGIAVFGTGVRWLPRPVAWVAAAAALSGLGLWEKGRLAEIEAIYVALTGIAFAWWLAAWVNRKRGFALWLVPALCMGLGLLTKGPTHMLLFYAVVIPVLFYAGEQRELWSAGHLCGLALAGLLFAAWAVPYFHATAALHADAVWASEMKQRVGVHEGALSIAADFLNALANGLPWILLAPLWWSRRVLDGLEPRRRTLLCAARWPLAIGFIGLVLIPGMVARYTLPFYPAIALLLALVLPSVGTGIQKTWGWLNTALALLLAAGAVGAVVYAGPALVEWHDFLAALLLAALAACAWPRLKGEKPVQLALGTALAYAAGLAIFAAAVQPKVRQMVDLRQAGAQVTAAIPADAPLYLVGATCSPVLFYTNLVHPCIYAGSLKHLPPDARYIITPGKKLTGPLAAARLLARFGTDKDTQMLLLEIPR